MERPEGIRAGNLELLAGERRELARLGSLLESRAAVKVLVDRVWQMRESLDTCTELHELAKTQGGIAALKEVISLLEGGEDNGSGNDE